MSISEDLEKTCEYIAILTFEHAKEDFTDETIAKESSRIERCLEWHYTYTKHHNSFEYFCINFLKENRTKFITRTDYQETYLNDVIEKEIYGKRLRATTSDKKQEVSYSFIIEEDSIESGFLIKANLEKSVS